MIEHRLWFKDTPLWQFIEVDMENCRLLEKVDEIRLSVDRIREHTPDELSQWL